MRRYVSFRDFDWTLLLFVLLICAVGVMQIYSATLNTKFAGAHLKQVYWILGGLAAMFIMSRVNYQALVDNVHWFYGIAFISLVAVLVVGTRYLGAKRWIKLPGGVHFQPSEWVKLVLILLMAKFFHELRHRETNFVDIAKAALLGAVPMLLVLRQPDLGTALTALLGDVLVTRRPELAPEAPGYGTHVLHLPDPAGGTVEVRRLEPPFTPAEYARASALVELAAAARVGR